MRARQILARRPRLFSGMEFYLTAYRQLQYDRPIGMDRGPIPYTSVVTWANMNGIEKGEQFETLLHIIRAVENDLQEVKDNK